MDLVTARAPAGVLAAGRCMEREPGAGALRALHSAGRWCASSQPWRGRLRC